MQHIDADVVVVGLGSAGARAALGFARAGRRVVAIDKRALGTTGARWVNAVPRWCFDEAGVATPDASECFGSVDGAAKAGSTFHLLGPGGRGHVELRDPPIVHVDMRRLVARLVRDALRAGVHVERASVADVEVDASGRLTGIVARRAVRTHHDDEPIDDLDPTELDGAPLHITARLFVDASGLGGALRSRVPSTRERCPLPAPTSRCVAAEFQFEVRDRRGLEAFLARHGARPGDDVGFPGVAGGFSTLTVFTTPSLDEVGILGGSIPALGVPDGAALAAHFAASTPWVGARRWGGRGAIPLGRPYATLVAPGLALVGDAASQVHAAHGSGVGIGLVASALLVACTAADDDPGALDALARYERRFLRRHGGLLASADAFRRFVQHVSRDDIEGLLGEGLLETRLASAALAQRPVRPDLAFLRAMLPRAARVPSLALRFVPLAARSAVLDRLGALAGLPRVGRHLATAVLDPAIGEVSHALGRGPWSLPSLDPAPSPETP